MFDLRAGGFGKVVIYSLIYFCSVFTNEKILVRSIYILSEECGD